VVVNDYAARYMRTLDDESLGRLLKRLRRLVRSLEGTVTQRGRNTLLFYSEALIAAEAEAERREIP